MLWADLSLFQPFVPHIGCQKDCCAFARQAVKHHTDVCSLPLRGMGERIRKKNNKRSKNSRDEIKTV